MKALIFAAGLLALPVFAQQTSPGPLSNDRIIQLVKGGIQQDELMRLIATAPSVSFDLTPTGTDALLKAGISEDTIKAMSAREQGIGLRTPGPQNPPIYQPSDHPAIPASRESRSQSSDFIHKGNKEAGFAGTVIIPHVASDYTTGYGSFRAGYYVTHNSLIGADATLLAESSAQAYLINGFYRYVQHTRNERLFPFAGVAAGAVVGHVNGSLLGYSGIGATESRFALKFEGGLKYFITRNVSFDTAYNLLYVHADPLSFKQTSASLIVVGLSFTF